MSLKDPNELVQFYIVNSEITMSTGKFGAQVAHVAMDVAEKYHQKEVYKEWKNNSSRKKIFLKAKKSQLEKLIEQGFDHIIDNGLTELPPQTLTMVALPPMKRLEAETYVKRLQLYTI
jgi:PTH2 family peptidyl-tRNA hydrolase